MPRAKKETNLVNVGNIKNNKSITDNTGDISLNTSIHFQLQNEKIYNELQQRLKFKKPNFISKFRSKEKSSRVAKNIKNMVQDTIDSTSYNLYQSIEAGPTLLSKKKYCDITGFESNYKDPRTGLRFYNADIYKIVSTLSEPIKNQYLSMRKALFVIK
jgi:INO80 complex subunit C